jgi:hypothetical protein
MSRHGSWPGRSLERAAPPPPSTPGTIVVEAAGGRAERVVTRKAAGR